ncbi:hypothetical protein GOV08_02080 [Candidatus Woesearchaeota archaeon]|nr:hypothetical protein [Candidatus Woesearchaeota archaeon]
MSSIIFDTGPIISLAMNNLLFILEKLENSFNGDFFITPAVKDEAIEKPLNSKKFEFEAIRVMKLLQAGVLKIYPNDVHNKAQDLLSIANKIFIARGNYINIVHYGEMEVVAAAIDAKADAIIIDERTTRTLIENPMKVKERLSRKLHTGITVDDGNLDEFKKLVGPLKILRSFELTVMAYEKGFLDEYLIDIENPKRKLLDGVLWGVKLSGCSVSENEISQVLKIEKVA